jgi:hypothetical protein
MVKERAEVVVILETPVALSHGKQIAELATTHRLLTMWAPRHVAAGGVLGFGTRLNEAYQRIPLIVEKILKAASQGVCQLKWPLKRIDRQSQSGSRDRRDNPD